MIALTTRSARSGSRIPTGGRYVSTAHRYPQLEIVHDVVFLQRPPIHTGYAPRYTNGLKEVGITQHDNLQTLTCLRVNTLTRFRNRPPRPARHIATPCQPRAVMEFSAALIFHGVRLALNFDVILFAE